MLTHLNVRDFALIRHLDVELGPGFTVITGETGAGKSIMVDAMGLLLGDRGSASAVRTGASRAELGAEFDLSELPAAREWLERNALDEPEDRGCVVRRTIGSDGRSRAFINGRNVTLTELRELGTLLVDIHGQHEHRALLDPETQLRWLDEYGSEQSLVTSVRDHYRHWLDTRRELETLQGQVQAAERERKLLEYQVSELEALELRPGEIESLETEQRRLAAADVIRDIVGRSVDALAEDDGMADRLARLEGEIARIDDSHANLANARELLASANIHLAEAAAELRRYGESVEINPERLREIDERLSSIFDAARKHQTQGPLLPELLVELKRRLAGLGSDEQRLETVRAAHDEARAAYEKGAAALSAQRRRAAKGFARDVSRRMRALGMPKATLEVAFIERESERGRESVTLLVSTNTGMAPGLLAQVASGGELSRLSLAVEVVAARKSAIPSLVLDEADIGIGGAVAESVGEMLRTLSEKTQVLCVTHLPQVAAKGHHHLRVTKTDSATAADRLGPKERVEELARMLAGKSVTQRARDHAQELLQEA
jgi:DNA repair protein RecN (Recombination protein N)